VLCCAGVWVMIVATLAFRAIRQFQAYEAVPTLPSRRTVLPSLTVIVPVRDEADNIASCLAGLAGQTYPADQLRILVVDDDSTDGTAAVVARLRPRVELIAAGALPDGWMGKPHACWRGALHANSDWLCFIDADVRPLPELLEAAVVTAMAQRIEMLSLQPFQELKGFWERLVVPVGMLIIACAQNLRRVDDRASPGVAANGQFILVHRQVYLAVNGHAAVRFEICEDKGLARRVKEAGYRLRMLNAERLARTRMYTDLRSLWAGFSKNTVEMFGGITATLAAATGAFFVGWTAVLLPLWAGMVTLARPDAAALGALALGLAASCTVLGFHLATVRYFQLPWAFGLLLPLSCTVAAALGIDSVRLVVRGRIAWKGRVYAGGRAVSAHPPVTLLVADQRRVDRPRPPT
jgi:chlorobactene glucosyltransferase